MTFLIGGILFSSDLLRSPFFQALATFVAINTLVYAGLSIVKIFPRKREETTVAPPGDGGVDPRRRRGLRIRLFMVRVKSTAGRAA
jgi:hypothetical protein